MVHPAPQIDVDLAEQRIELSAPGPAQVAGQLGEALAECVQEFRERRRRDPDRPANPKEKLSPEQAQKREAERRQRVDEAHRRDPRFMREVLSAVICYQRQKKDRAEAGIDEENRFARLGGEPDKLALYRYQSDLSQASKSLTIARKEIAEYGPPLACEDERLAGLAHFRYSKFGFRGCDLAAAIGLHEDGSL